MKFIKATPEEIQEYAKTNPVYPLIGFVKVDGHRCVVEFPNEGHDNPKYEVMAPAGHHFDDGLHSLLCFSLDDMRTRIAQRIVPCTTQCGAQEIPPQARRYRLTRPGAYGTGTPGREHVSARQGYYVTAASPKEAAEQLRKMKDFASDYFDVQVWDDGPEHKKVVARSI